MRIEAPDRIFTIRRYYRCAPSCVYTDLSEDEELRDLFCFNTVEEASEMLRKFFQDGAWMKDEKSGWIRHEVVEI